MWKEIIISIVIIVAVFTGNIITQNYTKTSVEELNENLNNLKEQINIVSNEHKNEEETKEKVKELKSYEEKLYEIWKKRHDKLAYYIEHDELEKVENSIVTIGSYVETGEYTEALKEIAEATFTLNHIKEKYAFNLENIF